MNKNAAIVSIILLLSVCLSTSCETGNGTGTNGAEKQLERTLSAVEGKKLLYESSSEIKMDGTTMRDISGYNAGNGSGDSAWDPVEALRLLNGVDKTVEFDAKPADGKMKSLLVKVDPTDWKQIVEKRIRRQLNEKKEKENDLVSSNRSRLPPEQLALMEKELQQSVSAVEDRLNGMFASLTAKGTYRILVEGSTDLPKKMTVENAMQYKEGENLQEEIVVSRYVFP